MPNQINHPLLGRTNQIPDARACAEERRRRGPLLIAGGVRSCRSPPHLAFQAYTPLRGCTHARVRGAGLRPAAGAVPSVTVRRQLNGEFIVLLGFSFRPAPPPVSVPALSVPLAPRNGAPAAPGVARGCRLRCGRGRRRLRGRGGGHGPGEADGGHDDRRRRRVHGGRQVHVPSFPWRLAM